MISIDEARARSFRVGVERRGAGEGGKKKKTFEEEKKMKKE